MNEMSDVMRWHRLLVASGHISRGQGETAAFEYIMCSRALLQSSNAVTGGWSPPACHSGNGKGPRAASLAVLSNMVESATLDAVANEYFSIDARHIPEFQVKGRLRPLIEAAFATTLMHYKARFAVGEMTIEAASLRQAYADVILGAGGQMTPPQMMVTHNSICSWGLTIQNDFNLSNLHLRQRKGAPDVERLVAAVRVLSVDNQSLHTKLDLLLEKVSELQCTTGSMTAPGYGGAASHYPIVGSSIIGNQSPLKRRRQLVGSSSAGGGGGGASSSSSSSSADGGGGGGGASSSSSTTTTPMVILAQAGPPVSLKDLPVAKFFATCMRMHSGHLPLLKDIKAASKARLANFFLRCFATPAEIRNKTGNKASQGAIATNLRDLVLKLFAAEYTALGVNVPAAFTKKGKGSYKPMFVGTVEGKVSALFKAAKAAGVSNPVRLKPTVEKCQAFRQKLEASKES